MTLSNSYLAYQAEINDLQAALDDPVGTRIPMRDEGYAFHYRARIHQARKLLRARSREVCEAGDPGYNTSAFDILVCTIVVDGTTPQGDDQFWVYIKHQVGPAPPEALSALPPEKQKLTSYKPTYLEKPQQIFLQLPGQKIDRRL